MAFESQTYSGVCKYRGIDFTFVFDGDELRLVPPADKKRIFDRNGYLNLWPKVFILWVTL